MDTPSADFRGQVLNFMESMRLDGPPYGRYRYAPGQTEPVLYASCYAALTRHLFGELDALTPEQHAEWVAYIQSFQDDDGMFRDPVVACELAETGTGWGWRHLTLHVLMALVTLGAKPSKRLAWLDVMRRPEAVQQWLKGWDWGEGLGYTSNGVQNWCVALQYARDFQGEQWADKAVCMILDFLDEHCDPNSGLWGPEASSSGSAEQWLSSRVVGAYHFWVLYFYDQRIPPVPERVLDSVLATQNELGGFGWREDARCPNSSACEDIDSVDPLVRFSEITDYRRTDVRQALVRARSWIVSNFNADEGAVFMRDTPYEYGHPLLFSAAGESGMFPTWFRALSLAILDWGLYGEQMGWQFLTGPGHQFK